MNEDQLEGPLEKDGSELDLAQALIAPNERRKS